jgi:hypothetical protein
MSHFKHNPDKRGTLASELGSSSLAEHDQWASLWANTKKPPRPARGTKRGINGCPPGYSYIDEYEDDDEEPVFFKQERSSETMETLQAKSATTSSTYHPRTHDKDIQPAYDAGMCDESDSPPRKRPAPDKHHATSYDQRVAFKVCSIFQLQCSAPVLLT